MISKGKRKYLCERFSYASGTVSIRANGEVVKERVRFAIIRGQWVAIPVR